MHHPWWRAYQANGPSVRWYHVHCLTFRTFTQYSSFLYRWVIVVSAIAVCTPVSSTKMCSLIIICTKQGSRLYLNIGKHVYGERSDIPRDCRSSLTTTSSPSETSSSQPRSIPINNSRPTRPSSPHQYTDYSTRGGSYPDTDDVDDHSDITEYRYHNKDDTSSFPTFRIDAPSPKPDEKIEMDLINEEGSSNSYLDPTSDTSSPHSKDHTSITELRRLKLLSRRSSDFVVANASSQSLVW